MTPAQYLTIMLLVCAITIISAFIFNCHKRKKIQKQDITEEKMLEKEAVISNFLAKNQLDPSGDISLILNVLKIKRGGARLLIRGQAHLSDPDKDGIMTATTRIGLTPQQQDFALAHECGHILNGDTPPISRPTGVHKPPSEQEADYIAAALLMPRKDVYNYLIEQDFPNATPRMRVRILRDLCEKYDVDDITAARRIQEVFLLEKLENK